MAISQSALLSTVPISNTGKVGVANRTIKNATKDQLAAETANGTDRAESVIAEI
jgi:hypothetical protein